MSQLALLAYHTVEQQNCHHNLYMMGFGLILLAGMGVIIGLLLKIDRKR